MGIHLDLAVLLRININCDTSSVCVRVPLFMYKVRWCRLSIDTWFTQNSS